MATHSAVLIFAVALLAAPQPQAVIDRTAVPRRASDIDRDPPPYRDRERRPVVLKDDALVFTERFSLRFQRTLRIPDDGKTYPLPPGLGSFPVYRVRDFPDVVPEDWDREKGYFIPMYQREAMWIDFDGTSWKPNAVKVGVGQVDAVSGAEWSLELTAHPQNYVVVPDQPWLDGIKSGDGTIRQFIAVPLGSGYSVEAQVTGRESDGALRIAVFEPRPGRFPDQPPEHLLPVLSRNPAAMKMDLQDGAMGLGAGGQMKQKVYEDRYGYDTWLREEPQEVILYLINSEQFEEITGRKPPDTPVDAATYTSYGYPWFDLYDEHLADLSPSRTLGSVKSAGELDRERGNGSPHDSSLVVPDSLIIKLH